MISRAARFPVWPTSSPPRPRHRDPRAREYFEKCVPAAGGPARRCADQALDMAAIAPYPGGRYHSSIWSAAQQARRRGHECRTIVRVNSVRIPRVRQSVLILARSAMRFVPFRMGFSTVRRPVAIAVPDGETRDHTGVHVGRDHQRWPASGT